MSTRFGTKAMNTFQGHLLIASPQMGDPRFARSVVLLLQHDEDGAFGVILNRTLPETIKGLWRKLGDRTCQIDRQLNMGGPVSGPIIALHGLQSAAEFEIPPGLYVAEQKQHLQQLVSHPECPMRIFIGHAGWSEGQLESELQEGAWLTLPATVDHVFGDDEDLWVNAIRDVGRAFMRSVLEIQHFPDDVTMN